MTTPSALIQLSSGLLAETQARLRQIAITSTDIHRVNQLLALRDAIDARQRRIMRANLAVIDNDPAVLQNVGQLTQLAAELAAGVQQIRSITSAIGRATQIISLADQLLSLAAIA